MAWRNVDGTGEARELGAGTSAQISPDGRRAIYLLDERGRAHIRYADVVADGTFGPPQSIFRPLTNRTLQALVYPPTA